MDEELTVLGSVCPDPPDDDDPDGGEAILPIPANDDEPLPLAA